tara:strand:- start:4917 stop:6917 length:2001 start_codon:yes stop_codon:yes gene_type:complete
MSEFEKSIIKARKKAQKRLFIFSSGLFVVFLFLISFFILSRGVDLKIYPNEANEDININVYEGFAFNFGKKVYALTNKVGLMISSPGYAIYQGNFDISLSPETIEIVMKELPGSLKLEVYPHLPNTDIFLNKKRLKNSKIIIEEGLVGNYDLQIKHPYFLPYFENINFEKGQERTLKVELKKQKIKLNIVSEPPEAAIRINGVNIGKTPIEIPQDSGELNFKISKEGYTSKEEKISLNADNYSKKINFKLELLPGNLTVNVEPSDAKIFINNKLQTEEIKNASFPVGIHNININKEGFRSINSNFTLDSNKDHVLEYNLEEIVGKVNFYSEPSSQIFIDGVSYGNTPKSIKIRSIPKKIKLSKDGYRSYSAIITSDEKFEKDVNINLKTEIQARFEESPKIYENSIGAKMIIFGPTNKFTLGSSRNDIGNRANETIREVVITKPFYVSKDLITEEQYSEFNKNKVKGNNLPKTKVSWFEAAAFCNWLSQKEDLDEAYNFVNGNYKGINKKANGYRLITEAEWVWVARYFNKKRITRFSWGNDLPPRKGVGNLAGKEVKSKNLNYIENYQDSFNGLSPVGSFKKNRSGINDITGNAKEWTHDYYSFVSLVKIDLDIDRIGPEKGTSHVIRGSSWRSSSISELRLTYREKGEKGRDDVGFRLARWLGE